MNIQGKVWGQTSLIFNQNNVEMHRIIAQQDKYCSKHKHDHKYNLFFVEKGKIKVKVWKDYGLVDESIVSAGNNCIVLPGEYHQFISLEDETVVYEIYWVQLSPDDIVRDGVGGTCE